METIVPPDGQTEASVGAGGAAAAARGPSTCGHQDRKLPVTAVLGSLQRTRRGRYRGGRESVGLELADLTGVVGGHLVGVEGWRQLTYETLAVCSAYLSKTKIQCCHRRGAPTPSMASKVDFAAR